MTKSILTSVSAVLLAGCATQSVQSMSPEQLKAMEGMVTCSFYQGMYGKAGVITVNNDVIRKGATSKSKVVVANDCTVTIDGDVGVAPSGVIVTPLR